MKEELIRQMLEEKGYIDEPVDRNLKLVDEIQKLKREKNAVILGHYYISPELQDISDYLGDSLVLAQAARETSADLIVFLGVHFMAETAKIINPEKKVILPDLKAGCSLATSAPYEKFAAFKKEHPGHKVITYINSSAAVKTLSDVICTSSNARKIVESFSEDTPLIFAPDKNLGNYLNGITGRNMVLWDGACMVHEKYSLERILALRKENPGAKFIAHPECEKPVLLIADFVGSTSALLRYVQSESSDRFIVATESGILHQMQKVCPNKVFIPAPSSDLTCECNDCSFMKLNNLQKLYIALKYEIPEIKLSSDLIEKAKAPIMRMLEISK